MDKLLNAILIKRLNEQDKKITDSFNNIKEVVETIVNKHYDSLNVDFSIEKILEEINTRYNTIIDTLSQDIGKEFKEAIQELKYSNQDTLDKSIKDYITKAEKKIEKLKPKDGKDGKDGNDGKDYVLTEKDKNDIASSVDIKEKEIEEIRDGIEKLVGEEKLDVLELKNLEKIEIDASQVKNLPQAQVIYKGSSGGGISQETLDNALLTKADLVDGKVPAEQLPSYVDDVVEYDIFGDFPVTGESGKIYVDKDTNTTYRWGGSTYIQISGGDSGSNQGYLYPTELTYLELISLINSSQLEKGSFYRITDFIPKYKTNNNILVTGEPDKITIQALSENEISFQAYSYNYPAHEIKYSIEPKNLYADIYSSWDNGVINETTGNRIISISNTSFSINFYPEINDNFYSFVEDENTSVEINFDNYLTDWNITDNSDGTYTINWLSGGIDFLNTNYNYGEISCEIKLSNATGTITYRKDTIKNIEADYDYKNIRYVRYNIDESQIPTWDSSTTYQENSLVIHSGIIYRAILKNTNSVPDNLFVPKWAKVISTGNNYVLIYDGIYDLPASDEYKIVPVFGYLSGSEFVYSEEGVSNVILKSPNVVFLNKNSYMNQVHDVVINKGGGYNTFYHNAVRIYGTGFIAYSTFLEYVSDLIVDLKIENSLINLISESTVTRCVNSKIHTIASSKITSVQNFFAGVVNYSTIGNNTYSNYGKIEYSSLGQNNVNMKFLNILNSKILDGNKKIEAENAAFNNSSIGSSNKFIRFKTSVQYSSIGDSNGREGYYLEISGLVLTTSIGSQNFAFGTSTIGSMVRVSIANTCGKINVPNMTDTQIGNSCNNINANVLNRVIMYSQVAAINATGRNIESSVFDIGTTSITSLNSNIVNADVKTGQVNFGTAPTVIGNVNYRKQVINLPNGTKKISYINNNGSLTVVPVTT